MQTFITAAETGVAQGAVAAAIARELVKYAADPAGLLVNVELPRVAKVFTGELSAGKDWGKGTDFKRD